MAHYTNLIVCIIIIILLLIINLSQLALHYVITAMLVAYVVYTVQDMDCLQVIGNARPHTTGDTASPEQDGSGDNCKTPAATDTDIAALGTQ